MDFEWKQCLRHITKTANGVTHVRVTATIPLTTPNNVDPTLISAADATKGNRGSAAKPHRFGELVSQIFLENFSCRVPSGDHVRAVHASDSLKNLQGGGPNIR
jgi:hypothetical protein